jgi:hypothetical protein
MGAFHGVRHGLLLPFKASDVENPNLSACIFSKF